ncbi:hydrolase, haloacid dehydrogenase [Citreicella sp. SE45]|nr:hydrolase, haloacid dehydrogenase [Citreicella sp. SE45]
MSDGLSGAVLPLEARIARARGLLDGAQRILCDLDGCLVSGARVLPGVAGFVRRHAERLVIVSNNSTDTAETLSRRLAGLGLMLPAGRMVLAGEAALGMAQRRVPSGRLLLLAGAVMQARARALGLDPLAATPEAVVLCRDASRSQLEAAMPLLARGLPLIVANPDLTHPGEDGPVIETGALLALLEACVPRARSCVAGKPSAHLFRVALGPVAPEAAVMIGDNPDTDIAGARRLGMPSIHVGPGGQATGLTGFDCLFPDETDVPGAIAGY